MAAAALPLLPTILAGGGAAAGIGTGSLIMAGIGAGASMLSRQSQASAEQAQLDIQRQTVQLQASQRAKARAEKMNSLLSSNIAAAAAKGISEASPTFKTITTASIAKFQEDDKLDTLNLNNRLAYLDAESENVDKTALFGMFADLGKFGEGYFNTIDTKMPKVPRSK